MGDFKMIAQKIAALPMDRQDAIADFIMDQFKSDLEAQSLLSAAQNEELRVVLSQPIEIASDQEMEDVFGYRDKEQT